MSQNECSFHSKSFEDWTGATQEFNVGIFGTGLLKASVDEDEKVLEIDIVPPDNLKMHTWKIPVLYCPVCGKKL